MFREDGYINGTKAAKAFGKDIREFFKLDSTKQYMDALEAMMGIPLNALKETRKGDLPGNGGTWIHPKLNVRLGQWLDVRFAVWCDLMIDNILKGNIHTSVVVPTKEAVAVHEVAERRTLYQIKCGVTGWASITLAVLPPQPELQFFH